MKKKEVEVINKREKCVLCKSLTEYFFETPISQRKYFIEGAGQLCEKCFQKLKNGGGM